MLSPPCRAGRLKSSTEAARSIAPPLRLTSPRHSAIGPMRRASRFERVSGRIMLHCWQGCPEGRARVLVTGVGGNIGQGILKALTAARLASWTVGTDCERASVGLSDVDCGCVVSRALAPAFGCYHVTVM